MDDSDVPMEMARLALWCSDLNCSQGEDVYGFVHVVEEGFKNFKAESFRPLQYALWQIESVAMPFASVSTNERVSYRGTLILEVYMATRTPMSELPPVVTGPRRHTLEDILRFVDPIPADEMERFVAAIYAERRASEVHPASR